MGLAASQARFLGITARKSNIEYEGQQVNQQRTALAEEVNSLYNKLLSLEVPIAPDVTKFYETDYSFELTNTSSSDGSYLIKSYYENADGLTYTVNAERTYKKQVAVGTKMQSEQYPIHKDEETGKYYINGLDENPLELTKLTKENSQSTIEMIKEAYGQSEITGDSLYFYKDATGLTHYLDAAIVESETLPEFYSTYAKDQKEFTEPIVFENATLTFDANNRMSGINVDDLGTFQVNTQRVYNTEEYDAALRDYTMSKEEYDKMVADLNAQTESLQQEDKVLELRLNQVDTEQNELQTELEAVKAILDKNVENTFNTFS